MGISYAGVDLLLDTEETEIKKWLDQWVPLDGLRVFGDLPPSVRNRPLGLVIPNYARELPIKLNTWYSPTGASRWSFGLFLATGQMLSKIINSPSNNLFANSTSQTIPTGANTLVLNDTGAKLGRACQALLLPPHPISVDNSNPASYWLLPIVDVRYTWQYVPVTGNTLTNLTDNGVKWADLLADPITALLPGMTGYISPVTPPTAYLRGVHQWTLNSQAWQNLAVLFDVILASVGWRLVPRDMTLYGGANPTGFPWFAVQDPATAIQVRNDGFLASEVLGSMQVGVNDESITNLGTHVPATISVVFRNYVNGLASVGSSLTRTTYTFTPAQCGVNLVGTGMTEVIRSTAYADYTITAGAGPLPDNDVNLRALALQIATDRYGWLKWQQWQTYAGPSRQLQTGFDDYREYSFERHEGYDSYVTRVHTMPHNFTIQDLLHWDNSSRTWTSPDGLRTYNSKTWEWGNVVAGTLDANLAPFGTQTITVQYSDDYHFLDVLQPDGITFAPHLIVKDELGQTSSTGTSVVAIRSGNDWLITNNGVSAASPQLTGNFAAATVTAGNTGTFTLTGGGTVTATVPKGVCIKSTTYMVSLTDAGTYQIINPTMSVLCQVSAHTLFGNTVSTTLFSGTQGSEVTLSVSVTAFIRRGIVFTNKTYEVEYFGNGWEIIDPDLRVYCKLTSGNVFVGNAATTVTIWTGHSGAVASTGIDVTAWVNHGILFGATDPNSRTFFYVLSYAAEALAASPPTVDSWVVEDTIKSFFVKNLTGSAILLNTTGPVTILWGTQGAWTSTGVTVTAYTAFSQLANSAIGWCHLDEDSTRNTTQLWSLISYTP